MKSHALSQLCIQPSSFRSVGRSVGRSLVERIRRILCYCLDPHLPWANVQFNPLESSLVESTRWQRGSSPRRRESSSCSFFSRCCRIDRWQQWAFHGIKEFQEDFARLLAIIPLLSSSSSSSSSCCYLIWRKREMRPCGHYTHTHTHTNRNRRVLLYCTHHHHPHWSTSRPFSFFFV